jgi:hypothetical protein
MMYSDFFADAKQRVRARWSPNAAGVPFCTKHRYELRDEDFECAHCQEDRLKEARAIASFDRIGHWFGSLVGRIDGLGGLPTWPYARFGNKKWVDRCNPRLVEDARTWDFRSWRWRGAKTGEGKTTTLAARYFEAHAAAIKAAQRGEEVRPRGAVYCTGSDLAEAQKRRHFDERHRLIDAVMQRPVAIIDEITRAPVELVFEIIDERFRAGLTTVACAGTSAREFTGQFGSNVLRRFFDMGTVIDCFEAGK